MPSSLDQHEALELLKACREIARGAGEEILRVYNHDFEVEHKKDNTPVTEADVRASDFIIAALARLTPSLPVISEEASAAPWNERRLWQRYWLIDPLDGTREFIKRNGEFTVNIALIDQHKSVLGVVDAPAQRLQYSGIAQLAAWRHEYGHPPLAISAREMDEGKLHLASTRSRNDARLSGFKQNLPPHSVTHLGSSLKICLIAEGKADLYPRVGPTSEWDTAAAQVILETAGGHVTDTEMKPLRYNTKPSLLNPEFFAFGKTRHNWSEYLPPEN